MVFSGVESEGFGAVTPPPPTPPPYGQLSRVFNGKSGTRRARIVIFVNGNHVYTTVYPVLKLVYETTNINTYNTRDVFGSKGSGRWKKRAKKGNDGKSDREGVVIRDPRSFGFRRDANPARGVFICRKKIVQIEVFLLKKNLPSIVGT